MMQLKMSLFSTFNWGFRWNAFSDKPKHCISQTGYSYPFMHWTLYFIMQCELPPLNNKKWQIIDLSKKQMGIKSVLIDIEQWHDSAQYHVKFLHVVLSQCQECVNLSTLPKKEIW